MYSMGSCICKRMMSCEMFTLHVWQCRDQSYGFTIHLYGIFLAAVSFALDMASLHAVAYPGFQREGCLRSGPIQKVGGGPIYEKWGGGGALQVRYTKSGGGGGGGGAIPLQVRYLWAHRKNLHDRIYAATNY